jgi:hypothetical protein
MILKRFAKSQFKLVKASYMYDFGLRNTVYRPFGARFVSPQNNENLKNFNNANKKRNSNLAYKSLQSLLEEDLEYEIFEKFRYFDNKNLLMNVSKNNWKISQEEYLQIVKGLFESFMNQRDFDKFSSSVKIQMLFSLGKIKVDISRNNRIMNPELKSIIFDFMKEICFSVKKFLKLRWKMKTWI